MQLLQDNLTRWLLYSTDTPSRPCLYHPLLTANARVIPCGNATPPLPLQPHPCHKCQQRGFFRVPKPHLPTLDGAPLMLQNASDVTAGAHCLHVQRGTVGLGAVTWRWPMSDA